MKDEPPTGEYSEFKSLLNRLMGVPHSVIAEREAEYKRRSKLNPSRRGPKPKRGRGDRETAG
jgi:hypothetical protein